MRKLFTHIITPLVSFIGGFLAYSLTLKIVWGESLGGDMDAVLFFGGMAFFLIAVPIYFGIIYFIDTLIKKFKAFLYPIGCILVFFIPTLMITLFFGSTNLLSGEAMLFHSFFLTSGLIFGLSIGLINKIKFKES